jgi:hypothetical protein
VLQPCALPGAQPWPAHPALCQEPAALQVCVSVPQLPQGTGLVCPALHCTHAPSRHAGVAPEQAAPSSCQAVPAPLHFRGCAPAQLSVLGVQTMPPVLVALEDALTLEDDDEAPPPPDPLVMDEVPPPPLLEDPLAGLPPPALPEEIASLVVWLEEPPVAPGLPS